jgi:hypothetical protein
MSMNSPEKRRMWVLPIPTGTITAAKRSLLVVYWAFKFTVVRVLSEISALFLSAWKTGKFDSPHVNDTFNSVAVNNVFVSSDNVLDSVSVKVRRNFISPIEKDVFISEKKNNVFMSKKSVK